MRLKRQLVAELTALPPAHRRSLASDVYVSLTSHPPRYKYLTICLASLLNQTVRPVAVTLWLEPDELAQLPAEVVGLQRFGLRILACEPGLRSYKKILPQIEATPKAYVAIADDDCVYPNDWLEGLISAVRPEAKEVLCYRGHMIQAGASGRPLPYKNWQHEASPAQASPLLMPTGVAGVLFPPNAFDSRVADRDMIRSLAPTGDDLWLYWHTNLRGIPCRVVGARRVSLEERLLPSSGVASLGAVNQKTYDAQIAAMAEHYGFPPGSRWAAQAAVDLMPPSPGITS